MVGLSKIDAQGEKTVSKSAYRQPITPQGLKAIEAGTLTWLDDEMYNNLNTGVLEQYLEEKNLQVIRPLERQNNITEQRGLK